ncbi:hypothetical protein niasHT_022189 [Heterodera trifolii]|uniref:Protein kinase domain-containing protein n=1 Tax=Heterodera trifolii TaxID=157864 RepID=A0ABD2JVR9_9BILA
MAVTGNAPSLVTGTNSSSGNNSNSNNNNNTNIDSNNTTVIHNSNHNTTSEDGDWVKSLPPPPVEEATVVDSAAVLNCSPPMSTISLSSASPASVTYLGDSGDDNTTVRRVPNSPIVVANSLAKHSDDGTASPAPPPPPLSNSPSSANFNSDFLSCFAPLGRFWPHNLFNWSSQKQIHSDNDTENYEIPIDSIDVQWEENFIGGGNQSSVFRGKYRGQWIALKKLNRTSEVDIKRLCSLEHANVIKTLGICTKEHFPCIVMEYCEKGSLFEHLRRNPNISKSMFINCSVQIAEGMCYLHSLKIVHRDLKSPNILIDKNNTVKICDFGSLYSWDQRLNSQTQNLQGMASVVMSVCGTSQWMSPEMLTNKPCNERVDVWSYGVVLWELLTGEVPYDKLPPTTVWFLVGSGNLQLHVPKTAPGSVSFLLTLCWAKNPRNRPSFKTILKDLLSNVKAELAELQEEGWGYRREQWKRDITDKMAKLHNSGMDFMGEQQREQELVKKRMHELRHAQEIRQMYEEKLQRVNKMHTKMCRFTELMNERKRDNERVADAMRERLAYDAHWHATLHEWHAELREWHAELRQQAATMAAPAGNDVAARTNVPKLQNNSKEELRHILLRAETAKTAAMLTHGHEEPVEQQHQQQWPMRASSTFKLGGQQRPKCISQSPPILGRGQCQAVQQARPAMLRMTYYDYDGAGRRHIGQKVMAQPQHQQQQQFRKFQRQQISSPMVAGSAASCSSSSRDCSSAEDNDDDNEHPQQQRDQPVPATQQPPPAGGAEAVDAQKRRKSCRHCKTNKRKMQMMMMKLHHQLPATTTAIVPQITAQQQQQKVVVGQLQEEARMGSCSSDTAMLRSSFGRNSADFELSSSKPISRDDSAISSTMPFSTSDRSLQNISLPNNNNNININNCSSTNMMACLNCQFGIQPQQISQFFARNSVARASGLSADSGVCQEDECVDGNANNNNNNWLLTAAGNGTKTCCLAPNTCQCVQMGVGTTTTISNRRNSSSPTTTTAPGTSSNYNKWSSPTKDHLHYHHHHHFQHKEARLRRRRPPASAAGVAHRPVASQLSASFTRNCTLRKPSIRRARSRRRLEQQGALDYDLERLGSILCSSSVNVSLADRRLFSNAAGVSSTTNNSLKSFSTNCGLISMDQSTATVDQRLCRRDSSCSSSDQSDQRGGGQQFVPPLPPPILISAVQHHHPHHWFSTPELYQDDQHQQQQPSNDNEMQKKTNVCDGHHPAFGCEAMALNVMNNNNSNNKNIMAMDCEPEQEQLQQNNNTLCCPISGAEMADPSPVTQKALAAEEAAMAATLLESLLSSSTMVSSLERSLELSAAHSDGLSDKEAKLKEVKTTFKLTHRRTSSNPINFLRSMPAHQLSTSSSSANGAKSVDNRHQNSLAEDGTTTEESEEKDEEEEEEEQILQLIN